MSSAKFDRYMVVTGAARHAKFRRLTIPERHAFFLGVLSIAAQAPIRGCLLVGNLAADAGDVASEADVPEKVAESAMVKLRLVGVLLADDELGCEVVHDFHEWNPAPKSDATNAERQRRYRDKLKASRNGGVTRNETPTVTRDRNDSLRASAPAEVEVEVEEKKTPPTPQQAGGSDRPTRPRGQRRRDLAAFEAADAAWLAENAAHPDSTPPKWAGVLESFIDVQSNAAKAYLDGLHFHSETGDGRIALGIQPGHVGWVGDRASKPLAALLGKPVLLVACDVAAKAAA